MHGAGDEIDWAGRFSKAYKAAKSGDSKGFDSLLAIEEAGVSAEYSEVSLETLQCLLLSDSRSWLRAMARIDRKRFDKYVSRNGLVFMMPPDCVRPLEMTEASLAKAESEYLQRAAAAVQAFEGSKPEMEVRDRVLAYLREASAKRK